MNRISVNAVVFEKDGIWIAQCLEFNFVSCSDTLEELPEGLLRQMLAQIEADAELGQKPFANFGPAPAKYWEMFEQAKSRTAPIKPKKGLLQRCREFLEPFRVDALLFTVPAGA